MSKRTKILAIAFGLTTITMMCLIEPLIKADHTVVYHWSGTTSALFGPAAIYTVLEWTIFSLLLLSAQRPGRWRFAVWCAVLLLIPWAAVKTLDLIWLKKTHEWVILRWPVDVLLWGGLVLLWRPSFSKRFDRVIEFASTVLSFVAISGVLFFSQFLWFWWQARSLNQPRPLHAAVATQPNPRIIWIVLDELSYQQVYERRYPGLQLPAFDALADQSTVFTHTVPEGEHTQFVLPALITGKAVVSIRPSGAGQLFFREADSRGWVPLDQHDTIFQDALHSGYQTAIAGWFNPYCRIMPQVLDHCYWTLGEVLEDHLASDGTLASNFVAPLSALIGYGTTRRMLSPIWPIREDRMHEAELHVADYEKISAAADADLKDPSITFALLHLPIPHPPGIYDRATAQVTPRATSYIDNLALADRYLAHVRTVLQGMGEWDSSTVIVMGDHSWRTTLLWKDSLVWSAVDNRASEGGKFDDRPAYIVKLPGEQTGQRIDVPFQAVRTRALLDELLAGRLRSPDDLRSWVGVGTKPNR